MYFRKVSLRIKREAVHTLTAIYGKNVLPVLGETEGCLFAALMQDVRDNQACSTVTMWRKKSQAEEYEKSGLYQRLLSSLRHLFREPSDWNIDPSEDLSLDYTPTPERPAVVGFEDISPVHSGSFSVPTFIHFLSLRTQTDKVGEFRSGFTENIQKLYADAKGYQAAFLMHRTEDHSAFHVLSFWDAGADPTEIVSRSVVESIFNRSKNLLATDPVHRFDDGNGHQLERTLFRCLSGEWFSQSARLSQELIS